MHLCPSGKWAIGKDQWGKIVRVNMLKITKDDWADIPGVKKAWQMKGFEGEQGMAFHPIISDIKDVDGDGKLDIFRCRSEHPGARIERLRVLVKRQWDHCTKAESTLKVSLERPLMGPP